MRGRANDLQVPNGRLHPVSVCSLFPATFFSRCPPRRSARVAAKCPQCERSQLASLFQTRLRVRQTTLRINTAYTCSSIPGAIRSHSERSLQNRTHSSKQIAIHVVFFRKERVLLVRNPYAGFKHGGILVPDLPGPRARYRGLQLQSLSVRVNWSA